nr:MAG TPA: hypothetical protein [Caudoviricetes sp.]
MVTTISFIFKINKNNPNRPLKRPRRNYRDTCYHSLLVSIPVKGWCER